MSQPPFLIALAGKFVDLGAEYNVRGLGRGDIAPEEVPEWGGGCCAAVGGWGLDDGFETCFFLGGGDADENDAKNIYIDYDIIIVMINYIIIVIVIKQQNVYLW